jgi:hypothetical protein
MTNMLIVFNRLEVLKTNVSSFMIDLEHKNYLLLFISAFKDNP